jgi:predicted Zn-dependent protease
MIVQLTYQETYRMNSSLLQGPRSICRSGILRVVSLTAGLALAVTLTLRPAQAMTDEEEIRMGANVQKEAMYRFGEVLPATNPVAVRVKRIGASLAKLSTRRNIPYSYNVLDNKHILNAFAAPGGPIYITTGMVELAESDAELASILAHETAHIDRRHMARSIESAKASREAKAAWSNRVFGKGKEPPLISAVTGVAMALWSQSYSRDQESEADALGARWLSRLGFDPRASVSLLGKSKLGGISSGSLASYLSSHPPLDSRCDTLTQQIETEKLLQVARKNGGPKLWLGAAPKSKGKTGTKTPTQKAAVPTPAPPVSWTDIPTPADN